MWVFANSGAEQAQEPAGAAGAESGLPSEAPGVAFDGDVFARVVDCYSDEAWGEATEAWAVDLLRPVIQAVFPEAEDQKLKYHLFLPR